MANLPAYNPEANALQSALACTYSNVLAANVPEFITVPKDDIGQLAKVALFKSTGDFYAQAFTAADAAERSTNGDFASNVTNGTFGSDTGWTKGTGWTIAAGVATATGAISTTLSQTAPTALIPGQKYTITFTATQSAGTVTVSVGGTAGTARSTSSTFTETIVAGTDGTITFTGAGFSGTLDNVIMCAWELGSGWANTGGVVTATTASTAVSQIAPVTTPLKQGQAYYVTYTTTRSAGSIAASLGGGTAGATVSSATTTAAILIAGSAQDISFTGSGFSGTVDNVTVVPCSAVDIDNIYGTGSRLNPNGYMLNKNITTIALCSGGTPVISTDFYK